MDANDLTRLARELQVEIAKLPTSASPTSSASSRREIRVEPDPERLSLYGDHAAAARRPRSGRQRSFQLGLVREEGEQPTLVAGQTLQTLPEIGNLLLTARDGRPVYVRDVADVVLATDSRRRAVTERPKTDERA